MSSMDPLVCWKCGAELKGVIMPLSRRELCPACNAEQHVCKLCRHYDPRVADMCREDRAERVSDKERANFCDYFTPVPGAYRPAQVGSVEAAKQRLAELFGEPAAAAPQPGARPESGTAVSPADKTRLELEKLFGVTKKDGGKPG